MLKVISRFVGISVVTGMLASCSWYAQLAEPAQYREQRIGGYGSPNNDRYSQRFHELQLRIEALERENHHLKRVKGKNLQKKTSGDEDISAFPEADSILDDIRGKVKHAISAIDHVLNQIGEAAQSESRSVTTKEVAGIDSIRGALIRNEKGEIVNSRVNSTVQSQGTPTRYNYSVVYSYPDAEPWKQMWEKLNLADEPDKWRGVNREKPAYFIYVGAYLAKRDAKSRQENLLVVTGEEPQLRIRAISRAVASN